jgi:hypothetical protein
VYTLMNAVERLRHHAAEQREAADLLERMADRASWNACVPIGRFAMCPAQVRGAGEHVLVLLGDDYFALRAPHAAAAVVRRRVSCEMSPHLTLTFTHCLNQIALLMVRARRH